MIFQAKIVLLNLAPAHSPTLKLAISGIGGQNRRIRIEEGNSGERLADSGMTWACVDDACDVYTVGGYLSRDKKKLPSMTVSTDPGCYSLMS